MTREIVLDTETTGLDPDKGDRIIEIGCVELVNHLPTGRVWHQYINPERDVPQEVVAVHGITTEFLKDKPVFAELYADFLEFIGADSKLVIHNAEFDMKFINAELRAVGHKPVPMSIVTDTLRIAREKFPGSPASLDALCRRFGVDNSGREYHGALLDSQLLAEVYLELLGGRQQGLGLGVETKAAFSGTTTQTISARTDRPYREARPYAPNAEELAAHSAMVEKLTDPLWAEQG